MYKFVSSLILCIDFDANHYLDNINVDFDLPRHCLYGGYPCWHYSKAWWTGVKTNLHSRNLGFCCSFDRLLMLVNPDTIYHQDRYKDSRTRHYYSHFDSDTDANCH